MSLVNRAAKGDNDPVNLLRQAGLSSMQKRAGYIVPVSFDAIAHDLYWLCPLPMTEWVFMPGDKEINRLFDFLARGNVFEFRYKEFNYTLGLCKYQNLELQQWEGDRALEFTPLDQWPIVCAWAWYCDEMYYQKYGEK